MGWARIPHFAALRSFGLPGRHARQSAHPRLLSGLVAAGEWPEVALSACIGKLLALCNALCQHQTTWDPSMA